MLGFTGFLGLTQISQIPRYSLWVGNLTDGSVGGCGLLPWGSVGSLSRIYFSDPSDKSDPSDLSDGLDGLGIFKKIIREICGICVRPPWDWDLCEASVDSVGVGDKITKKCVIWGVF